MSTYKRPDHYTRKAKEMGYAARSVFKLDEIEARHRLLRPGARVLDLGCFPGSWSRFARERIGDGPLVGVDLQEPSGIRGTFIARSVYEITTDELLEALGGPADVVLSDMAPATTGDRFRDHVRQIELADRALEVACAVLRPGGSFVVKVFDGTDAQAFVARARQPFTTLKRIKPQATRDRSVEFFLVGLGFKGA